MSAHLLPTQAHGACGQLRAPGCRRPLRLLVRPGDRAAEPPPGRTPAPTAGPTLLLPVRLFQKPSYERITEHSSRSRLVHLAPCPPRPPALPNAAGFLLIF